MAEDTVAALNCKVANLTHKLIENGRMYAIKQINIFAEYREMMSKDTVG